MRTKEQIEESLKEAAFALQQARDWVKGASCKEEKQAAQEERDRWRERVETLEWVLKEEDDGNNSKG